MLFPRAFRTVGRKLKRKDRDRIAVLAIVERRVAPAFVLRSGQAPFGYQTVSGRATSWAFPRGPQLVKALFCRTGQCPLARPLFQGTYRRYEQRQFRADASC